MQAKKVSKKTVLTKPKAVKSTLSNNSLSDRKNLLPIALGLLLLFCITSVLSFYLGVQRTDKTPSEVINESKVEVSPIPEDSDNEVALETNTESETVVQPSSTQTSTALSIPSDWKKHTANDTDFGVVTTISLPPGFNFIFTGADTSIQNSEEVWNHTTSVYRAGEVVKNHYNGESRRTWLVKHLNGEFYPESQRAASSIPAEIVSLKEHSIGRSTYLELTIKGGINRHTGEAQKMYVFVQNGIVHMFEPMSNKATSSNSEISKVMGTIFTSLTSNQSK